MRSLTLVLTMTLIWGVASAALAQEAKGTKSPPGKKLAAKQDAPAPAELRAKMHRIMAALIEAQSAEEPDQAKIKKLTKQLQNLRKKTQAQGPPARAAWPGGPGRGYGRGPGWAGRRGPGWGRGPGAGRGYGPGWGRGPGAGRGYGPGWGRGPGRGYGPGPGYGRGYGRGWGFIDEDGDGVCDYFEKVWGKQ